MSNITHLLGAIEHGDSVAAGQLLPLVYDALRLLAAQKLAREMPGQTLDATALVHEAYLRLVGDQPFENRRHFFAAAAEAMRRILVDQARRKHAEKRGGDVVRSNLTPDQIAAPERSDELLALDDALIGLVESDPQAAELVKLRYFAGLTMSEAAETLGIPPRSADRLWAFARAWLFRAINS
jgi:RNA polymerase sigma factor (TIGR02999 family)